MKSVLETISKVALGVLEIATLTSEHYIAAMASAWAKSVREGWLCHLYGEDIEDGRRVLPSACIQSRLLSVLEGLLSHVVAPRDAATRTASLIMTQTDVSTPWSNHVGMFLGAVQEFDDEEVLESLVHYLVELASLPDAINEGPGMKTVWTGLGAVQIEPGQPIVLEEGRLWRDLPQYSWNLTEALQGPEQYLKEHGGSKEPLAAMQAWKSLNTYLALMAVHPEAQTISVLAGEARQGLKTLAMALEYSSGTRIGRNSELHAPAAAQWLRIAADEIQRLCAEGTERFMAGDLWQGRGGTEACDGARLTFWKSRLREISY